MIESHAITHRAHPAVPPLLHLADHLHQVANLHRAAHHLDPHLVPIKTVVAKICRLVVVQVNVVVQLEM